MPTPDPNCKHYWILDAKNFGVCKYCGGTQQFPGIGDIEKGQGNSWRSRRHTESLVEGGGDMPGNDGDKAHKTEEFTVEDVKNGAAPFTLEELSKAEGAGVKLKIKSEKEQKRRRHNPDSTLKKVKCTYPGCTLGPDGGPYECDPRALHLHIQLQHGVRKHRTPKRIVRRILELFDAGTPQVEIIAALKSQNNLELTSGGICGILNRERPDRVKWAHHKKKAPVKQNRGHLIPKGLVEKILKLFDGGMSPPSIIGTLKREDKYELPSSSLYTILNRNRPDRKKQAHLRRLSSCDHDIVPGDMLRDIMRLVVDGAAPEEIRKKGLEVKVQLSRRSAELAAQSRIIQDLINYAEIKQGALK